MTKCRVNITLPKEIVDLIEKMRTIEIQTTSIKKKIVRTRSKTYEDVIIIGLKQYYKANEILEGLDIEHAQFPIEQKVK